MNAILGYRESRRDIEMTDSENVYTLEGYRWRDELVDKLLPYIKDEIPRTYPSKQELLNNLLRGYVPFFFPTRIDGLENARWLFPLSLRPNTWWEIEIEAIGREFAEVGVDLDNNLVQKVFKRHNWEVDNTYVKGISLLDKKGRWKYDAYKNRIAVEVELTNRYHIFKDAFKFLIGQAMDQIDVGVIIVPKYLEKKKQPYLGWIDPNSHPIFTTLPMLNVAFYGFPNKAHAQDEVIK